MLATKSSLDPPPVSKAFRRARENNPTNDIYVSKDPSTLLFSLFVGASKVMILGK